MIYVSVTTLRPHLGILEYSDLRKISMADLPGLVEGASDDVGMGHEFLKHVERSSLLLLVVDIFGFQLTPQCSHRNCIESVILLNKVRRKFVFPHTHTHTRVIAVIKLIF